MKSEFGTVLATVMSTDVLYFAFRSSSDHGNVIASNSRHATPLQRSESFDRGHPDPNRQNVEYHILHGGSLRAPAMMNRHHEPYNMSAARG